MLEEPNDLHYRQGAELIHILQQRRVSCVKVD